MGLVAKRVTDKQILVLIRSFLTAGALADGLVSTTEEGTPQGGPLSPLLSNLMLDVLDRELETRKLNFVRYADDCNIYVRSQRAGERVMASIQKFLIKHLKLRVNKAKSAVARPSKRKFLGFSFTNGKQPRRCIAPQSLARFRSRVRELTRCVIEAGAFRRSSKSCLSILLDGAATSDSAKPRRSCATSTSGSDDGIAPSSGSNGNAGLSVLLSCDAAASAGTWRRGAPAAHMALGGSA